MPNKIDSAGTYIAEITEHSLGQTQKGFPQFVARFKAVQKYVGDTAGLEHFKLTEASYVDWSSFDEEIMGYLVLFNADKALMNYEQLQIATGWDGTEFDSLNNASLVGKKVLIRVEEDTYEGKTSLKVQWIDAPDAAPERTLKALDPAAVTALASKFLVGKAKPVAAASAAAKPAATKPGKPAAAPSASATSTVSSAPAPATTPPTAPKPPKAAKKEPAPAAEEQPAKPTLSVETSQADAWGAVISRKGNVDDTAIQDAWIAACQLVGGDRDEDDFTLKDWAGVRDQVIAALKL